MAKLSPHEALIFVMVTTAATDGVMNNKELASIINITTHYPVFAGFDNNRLDGYVAKCYSYLQEENGLEQILDLAHKALPEKLYDTAYALAVEIAATDLKVNQEELEFLQMMCDRWELDDLTVAALERSARLRFRKL